MTCNISRRTSTRNLLIAAGFGLAILAAVAPTRAFASLSTADRSEAPAAAAAAPAAPETLAATVSAEPQTPQPRKPVARQATSQRRTTGYVAYDPCRPLRQAFARW